MIWYCTRQILTPGTWNMLNWDTAVMSREIDNFMDYIGRLDTNGVDYLITTNNKRGIYQVCAKTPDIYRIDWMWKNLVTKQQIYNDSPGTPVYLDYIKKNLTQLRMEFVFPWHDNLRLVVTEREQEVRIGKSLRIRIKELVTEHLGFTEYSEYLMP